MSINELKEYFFSLQTNKSPGHDEISFDVVKSKSLLHIFRLSLEKENFPDYLKTAKVTPIVKDGDENDFGKYQPISVLSCFSKILEKIMCKSTVCFIKNSLVFNKFTQRNML